MHRDLGHTPSYQWSFWEISGGCRLPAGRGRPEQLVLDSPFLCQQGILTRFLGEGLHSYLAPPEFFLILPSCLMMTLNGKSLDEHLVLTAFSF